MTRFLAYLSRPPRPHRITFECADPTLWVDGACACQMERKSRDK